MTKARPLVSVIVPCRNERNYIAACLDSILDTDYPGDRVEVVVSDGISDDGTQAVLRDYSLRDARIRWLENPRRTTPFALNLGIQSARGDIVMIMGAHCRYPKDYISKLVSWLERSGADNVGGVCRTVPGSSTPMARAIAVALSHPFGVGNSYFRIGVSEPRWVDTVPFGCYWKNVFSKIGLFDEELVRNQDDELNQRLLGSGGRILLVPDVVSEYYARDTLAKVALMHYQYGYFKPLVARKLGRVGTFRQVVPVAFLLLLSISVLLAPWLVLARWSFAAFAGAYLLGVLLVLASDVRRRGVRISVLLAAAFPVIHFSYAWGSLRGIIRFLIRRAPAAVIAEVSVSR